MTGFLTLDVFTDRRFGGNPLAVIPDASALAEADLQRFAREFNYSETTFVTPPADPANTARVRIFTPRQEVAFAGHPVIGTAVALAALGHGPDMVLELGIGPLPCTARGDRARFTTRRPLERLASPEPALVARCLSLDPADLTGPPVQASLGLACVFAELTSDQALARCQPETAAMREGASRHPAGLDFAIFAYVRDGTRIEARMFAPLDGVPEDPATGSAAASLAALLAEADGADLRLTVRQGVAMGRPSEIIAAAELQHGRAVAVSIEGQAVRVMEGRLL